MSQPNRAKSPRQSRILWRANSSAARRALSMGPFGPITRRSLALVRRSVAGSPKFVRFLLEHERATEGQFAQKAFGSDLDCQLLHGDRRTGPVIEMVADRQSRPCHGPIGRFRFDRGHVRRDEVGAAHKEPLVGRLFDGRPDGENGLGEMPATNRPCPAVRERRARPGSCRSAARPGRPSRARSFRSPRRCARWPFDAGAGPRIRFGPEWARCPGSPLRWNCDAVSRFRQDGSGASHRDR